MNYLEECEKIIALSDDITDLLKTCDKKNNELIKIMTNNLLERLVELKKQMENEG